MNNLELFRKKAALTQSELSEKTAIPVSMICRAEKGVSDLKGQRWKVIAKVLGCSLDELLGVK